MAFEMQKRQCPLCSTSPKSSKEWLAPNYDLERLNDHSFASRKLPEYMTWGYRICSKCDLAYCAEIPTTETIDQLYTESHFSSDSEASDAAATYAKELKPIVAELPHKELAIDIGCGPGPLLSFFNEQGFDSVRGVEPAIEAVSVASPEIRKQILIGNFTRELFGENQASLICLFQTIEHLSDPLKLFSDVQHILKPGGQFVVICHNRDSWLNKLLNAKSPIIDVEHLQLFNPASLDAIAKEAGLVPKSEKSFYNTYPLSYWLLLAPIPKRIKSMVVGLFNITRLSKLKISVNVGNMVFVCEKPKQ